MQIKNNYELAYDAVLDSSIQTFDQRIANNFTRFFERENLNARNYDLLGVEQLTSLYDNRLDRNYYDADHILKHRYFNIERVLTREADDFLYINGVIQEAFRKKDMFLIKKDTKLTSPYIKNRMFGNNGGVYNNITLSESYPVVIM